MNKYIAFGDCMEHCWCLVAGSVVDNFMLEVLVLELQQSLSEKKRQIN
jgi:hypothetical protein